MMWPARGSVRPVRLSEIMTAGVIIAALETHIAVCGGNLEAARKMTQDVTEGAPPQFYFHERG